MSPLSFVLLAALAAADDGHAKVNPLFRDMLEKGVQVDPKKPRPLPAPRLADGLDADAQKAVLKDIAGKRYAIDDLLGKGPNAPHVWATGDVYSADKKVKAKTVDVYFVIHGSLQAVGSKQFLEKMLKSSQKGKNSAVHILTNEELTERKLTLKEEGGVNERYSNAVFMLLDLSFEKDVQLSATSRTMMSRTADSLLFASRLDTRFAGDKKYPNQWRPAKKTGGGKPPKLGEATPYDGSACYIKITKLDPKLAKSDDALFVESHLLFIEPKDWFPDGRDRLSPRIASVVQSQARSFRADVKKLK